jgi:hypothetical protein
VVRFFLWHRSRNSGWRKDFEEAIYHHHIAAKSNRYDGCPHVLFFLSEDDKMDGCIRHVEGFDNPIILVINHFPWTRCISQSCHRHRRHRVAFRVFEFAVLALAVVVGGGCSALEQFVFVVVVLLLLLLPSNLS